MEQEHRNLPRVEREIVAPLSFLVIFLILFSVVLLLAACASAERNYWAGVSTQVGKSYENSARTK